MAADRGASPRLDRGRGLRRARAAILLMLALPGSAYLYQGEELGLDEVPDIPLPDGTVILTSVPVDSPQLPADITAWLLSG